MSVNFGRGRCCTTIEEPRRARRSRALSEGNKHRAVYQIDTRWKVGETVKIAFMGGTAAQCAHTQKVLQTFEKYINLKFEWNVPLEQSDVRVAFVRGGGSWSFIGAQCRGVAKDRSTMNLGWLPDAPVDSDRGTILHEGGHMLGLQHEHLSPNIPYTWNRDVVIKALGAPPNNWSVATIEGQVLNKIDASRKDIVASEFDFQSIMLYAIDPSWTMEGVGYAGNTRLSVTDKMTLAKMYPYDDGRVIDFADDDDDGEVITIPPVPPTVERCCGGCQTAFSALFKKN